MSSLLIQRLRQAWSFRRDVAGAALHWSGVGRAFEIAARPTGAIILMYHSIARSENAEFIEKRIRMSPETFERQMRFLSRHRRVISISELVDEIARGKSQKSGTVCITFDDGYLDNLTVAAPILDKYRLPAMLYLATGYVEQSEAQWADRLHWQFRCRSSHHLSMEWLGIKPTDLRSPEQYKSALAILHGLLLGGTRDERSAILKDTEKQLAPKGNPPRLTMNWDEVRELRRRYPLFEIGGHTRDHMDLRKHRGVTALAQIANCAEDLRSHLGIEPQHFSFPYERWDAGARDAVISSGWKSAVGAGIGFRIVAGSDRYSMPRVEAPKTMTGLRFKTSGAFPGALSMLKFG